MFLIRVGKMKRNDFSGSVGSVNSIGDSVGGERVKGDSGIARSQPALSGQLDCPRRTGVSAYYFGRGAFG